MTTGYTAAVQDGKIEDFPEFAKSCARAFGALMHMRDDRGDAAITLPTISPYHKEALEKAQTTLRLYQEMSVGEWESLRDSTYDAQLRAHEERVERNRVEGGRYNSMLEKVQAWTPPSAEHWKLKKFMEDQLTESIRHDLYTPPLPEKPSVREFQQAQINKEAVSVKRHESEWETEQVRHKERCDWLISLFTSFGEDILEHTR